MSIQQIVSPTRYIGRGKPRRTRKDIEIYCCSECGTYLTGWTQNNTAPQHCSNTMRKVEPIPNDQLDPALQIDYKIKGSLNNNCIIVTWGRVRPEWILMESFRGSQFFYVENSYKEVWMLTHIAIRIRAQSAPSDARGDLQFMRCFRGSALSREK